MKNPYIKKLGIVFLITVILMITASDILYLLITCIAKLASVSGGNYVEVRKKLAGIISDPTVQLILSQLILFAPAGVYIAKNPKRFKSGLRFKLINPVTVILLFFFTISVTPLMGFLNSLSMLFSKAVIIESVTGVTTNYSLTTALIVVCLLPGVFEELTYRGLYYAEYRKVGKRRAILFSGLLFGLLHMNFNQFFYTFTMGMILALVLEATDSLVSTMLIHFYSNGMSIVSLYSQKNEDLAEVAAKPFDQSMRELAQSGDYSQGASDFFAWMGSFDETTSRLIFLGMAAVVGLVFAVGIYIALAYSCGRLEEVKKLFLSRETSEAEVSERKAKYMRRRMLMEAEKKREEQKKAEQERAERERMEQENGETEITGQAEEQPKYITTPALAAAMALSVIFMFIRLAGGF